MLMLYEHPLSSYAMKVKIALLEKGLEFQCVVPERFGTPAPAAAFVEASPRAEIPALRDGATQVFDSTIILEYLEDKWPTPALRPATPGERARVRMLEDLMDGQYEPNNWGYMEVTRYGRAQGALADKLAAFARDNIARLQAWLDRQLAARAWFNGVAFGWGDVVVAPYVNRSVAIGVSPPPGSRLAAWLEQVNGRESVAKTVEQMKQAIAKLPDLAAMLAAGQIVRQYRDHRLEWMIAAGGIAVVQAGIEKGTLRFSRLPE